MKVSFLRPEAGARNDRGRPVSGIALAPDRFLRCYGRMAMRHVNAMAV
ncbi:MAG TPA: hypothetical protein VME18_10920 [Acidobacteriaceae bacterium]|nr:hypothetical protein [Acidobacteriaceae bacterium]